MGARDSKKTTQGGRVKSRQPEKTEGGESREGEKLGTKLAHHKKEKKKKKKKRVETERPGNARKLGVTKRKKEPYKEKAGIFCFLNPN